jgi:hypothetical protein
MDSKLQRRYEVLWYQRQISAYLTGVSSLSSSAAGPATSPAAAGPATPLRPSGTSAAGSDIAPSARSAAAGSAPVDAEEQEGTAGTALVIASSPPSFHGFGSVFPGGAFPAVFIDASGAGTSSSSSSAAGPATSPAVAGPATPSRPSGSLAASLSKRVYSSPFLAVSPFPAVQPLDCPPRPSSAPPPSSALRDFWLDSSLCEASLGRYKSRWDNWCDFAASHRVSALPPDE